MFATQCFRVLTYMRRPRMKSDKPFRAKFPGRSKPIIFMVLYFDFILGEIVPIQGAAGARERLSVFCNYIAEIGPGKSSTSGK
jgi:hypothetical protein